MPCEIEDLKRDVESLKKEVERLTKMIESHKHADDKVWAEVR